MASKLYYCDHRWAADGTCERCGWNRADLAGRTGTRPDGASLPDWAMESGRSPRLGAPRSVAIPTATFDPWVTSPLGPSIIAAPVDPEEGESAGLPGDADNAAAEEQMLELVNAARAEAGLTPLEMDEAIRAVARAHSADMRARRFYRHENPDGLHPADRAAASGVPFRAYAENIAQNANVLAAHQAFMLSDGHRSNILNTGLRRIGIGIVSAPIRGILVTQNFAD